MIEPSPHADRGCTGTEEEILLQAARAGIDPAGSEPLTGLLRADLDWDHLLRTASVHGIWPLLYSSVAEARPQALPQAVRDAWRLAFQHHLRRNLFLTGEALRLLALFEAHALPALLFKGPALAVAMYGNPALRQFGDLDFLVPVEHMPAAKALLLAQGFRWEHRLTPAQEASFLRSEAEFSFERADGLQLDVHWRIVPRYFAVPLESAGVWQRLQPLLVAGRTIRTLAPEDLLLLLTLHGAKHAWQRLGWICDVAKLVATHRTLDWSGVRSQATRLSSVRMLHLGLFLAADLLGAFPPEEVWRGVQADRVVKQLARHVRARLFREPPDRATTLASYLFHLRARERLRDRMRMLCRLTFTPTPDEWDLLPVPSPLFPLYRVLRPVRLIGKYGLLLWRSRRWR